MFKKTTLFAILFLFIFQKLVFANNNEILNEVENYLNNINYLQANFLQDDFKTSELSEGVFYLHRPNNLRVDYKNPFEATLYSDSRTTIYHDKELDESNSIRTSSTPLYFLLKKKISFKSRSFFMTNFNENKNFIIISFKQNGKEEQGSLSLKFKKDPIELYSIKLNNELDQEVEMTLFNLSTKPINNSIFKYKKNSKK